MWALIRKNFSHEYWSGGFLLLGIGLTASFCDMAWSWSFGTWLVAVGVISFFAFLSGSSEFAYDSSKQTERFLEYLPIKRSSIWLANYLDGLLPILLLLAAAFWYKTINFTPELHNQSSLLQLQSPTSRWDLLIGGGAIALWFFSLNIYFRGYLKNDVLLSFISVPLALVTVVSFQWFLEFVEITPSLLELAPAFALSAVLLTASGFLMFSYIPPYVSKTKTFVFAALPVFLAIIAMFFGHLYLNCESWKYLEPNEKLFFRGYNAMMLNQNGSHFIICGDAISRRSGKFLVSIDVDSGEIVFYTKGFTNGSFKKNSKIVFSTYRYNHALVKNDLRYVAVDPDGSNQHVLLKSSGYLTPRAGGDEYANIGSLRFSPDGNYFLYTVFEYERRGIKRGSKTEKKGRLIVADARTMKKVKEFPVFEYDPFSFGEDGFVLVSHWIKDKRNSDSRRSSGRRKKNVKYTLRSINNDDEFDFTLPGPVLAFSANFATAVCLKPATGSSIHDDKPFSVVIRDIRAGTEKTLIAVSELASRFTRKKIDLAAVYGIPSKMRNLANVNIRYSNDSKQIIAYPKLNRMVWLKKEVKGEMCVSSLVVFDWNTLEKRVLKTDAFPPVPVDSSSFNPLLGFTPDGESVVCKNPNEIFAIDLASGEKSVLAKFSKSDYRYVYLSPNNDRVAVIDHFYKGTTFVTTIFDKGEITYQTKARKQNSRAVWIDDERLAFVEDDKIISMNADGSDKRQVYPKPAPAK